MIDIAQTKILELIDLGGPVVAILMGMSVVALAIVIWKAVVFEIEGIGRGCHKGFVGQALQCRARGETSTDDMRQRIHARLSVGFGKAAAGLRVLDVISQVAPLLGLFGTVLGMIAAFKTLQEAGSTADPSILAGGIWVALMTTAAGLVVAIPASLFTSWFDSRLEAHRRAALDAVEEALTPGLHPVAARPEAPNGLVPHAV